MKGIFNKIKLVIVLLIIFAFVWFLVIWPMITFHGYESDMEKATKKYFELNSTQLPTGSRVKTVSLKTLYNQSYLDGDMYVPYTNKTCSVENSWVKVKKENNEYKYYVYLECGVLSSTVDHTGPEIKLNGDSKITLSVGSKYTESGVKSVVDSSDGKLNTDDVVIKGSVDTSKVGTYEITYTAVDSLSNKTTVTRTVEVVKTLYSTVKSTLGDSTNYVGNPNNNYVRLSNMIYRIYGYDKSKNIILVADEDVANVNYTKLDSWLNDYYYEHLNETTQKMIVASKYCNMTVDGSNLSTQECTSYSKKKNLSVPSIVQVNKAQSGTENFMKPSTMSWVAEAKSDSEAYVTRLYFFGEEANQSFLAYDNTFNYGVRPMFTIKGSSLITGGSGTAEDPYVFGDSTKAKGGSNLNERYTGEYVEISGTIWRIIDVDDDGTTKLISNNTISTSGDEFTVYSDPSSDKITYNPKNKSSIGYYINNRVSKAIDTSYFVNHEIEVPIYKNNLIYGEEIKVNKYKVKLSAPNMYEMFSAQNYNSGNRESKSYWLINTSKADNIAAVITDIGVPVNEELQRYDSYGVRVVAYAKSDTLVSSGNGTLYSPYVVK